MKIRYDDASLTVESTSASMKEGNSIRIVVKLTQGPGSDIVAPVRVIRQGNTSAADFTVYEETVTFAAGEGARTITFNALVDDERDESERVLLTFRKVVAKEGVGPQGSQTGGESTADRRPPEKESGEPVHHRPFSSNPQVRRPERHQTASFAQFAVLTVMAPRTGHQTFGLGARSEPRGPH